MFIEHIFVTWVHNSIRRILIDCISKINYVIRSSRRVSYTNNICFFWWKERRKKENARCLVDRKKRSSSSSRRVCCAGEKIVEFKKNIKKVSIASSSLFFPPSKKKKTRDLFSSPHLAVLLSHTWEDEEDEDVPLSLSFFPSQSTFVKSVVLLNPLEDFVVDRKKRRKRRYFFQKHIKP